MDIYGWIVFFLSTALEIFGTRLILLSKDKLKGKTIKNENKNIYFIFGILLFSIGFSIFLFLMIILFR